MNRPVILAAGTPQILLPYDNANQFVRALPLHRGPLATWTAWTAPKTMKTGEAAKSVGMSEERLREVNHIPARMLIKAGSTLLVPRGNALLADVSSHVADNATLSLAPDAPPLRKVSFKAGRKDTVASVAKRYRVNVAQVAEWNRLGASASFAPGQSVVVYVAQPGRRQVQVRGTQTARVAHVGPRSSQPATSRSSAAPKLVRPATVHAGRRARSPRN
jgi:membrane-bound lytic murein transglycosylase D